MADCTPEHEDSGVAYAQGTTVSWGGANLGMLTSVQVWAGRSQLVDVTSVNATVLGSGTNNEVYERGSGGKRRTCFNVTDCLQHRHHCKPE